MAIVQGDITNYVGKEVSCNSRINVLQLIQVGNKYYMNLTRFHAETSVDVRETNELLVLRAGRHPSACRAVQVLNLTGRWIFRPARVEIVGIVPTCSPADPLRGSGSS